MKHRILMAYMIMQINQAFSQEIITEIHNRKIDYFIEIEENLKSEVFLSGKTFILLDDSAQPVFFKRREKDNPDLIVRYSFSKIDSTINEVLYEWDINNFEHKADNQTSNKIQKGLIEKYQSLKKVLTDQYGPSETNTNYSNLTQYNHKPPFFEESSSWKPNDSTEVVLYAIVSKRYEKRMHEIIIPTQRVRLYIKNINNPTY